MHVALPSGGSAPAAPQLRLVPGRIALFVVVLCAVSFLLVPRLMAATSTVAEPEVHIVQSGETLWGVAKQNSAGQDPRHYVYQLRQINRLSSAQIFPGQSLILP